MDSTRPVDFSHPHRQKPLSGLNTGASIARTVEHPETPLTGGKVGSDSGRSAVGENANPKAKVKCFCGNMIYPANLERHLRTHKFHNPIGRYVCDKCQARFTRKESLKRHIEEASCRKARQAVDLSADSSLPPLRSSTKRKRSNSGRNKMQAPPNAISRKVKAHHVVPKISPALPSTPLKTTVQLVNRPVGHSNPASASSQFDDDGEEGDQDNEEYDGHDDDDVYEDEFQGRSDSEPEAQSEDDTNYDADEPPRRPIEVTDILPPPIVDMSVNPALFDFLFECGINEDDEPFDPLYFGTSDVALMTNPYYRNDTYIHF